MLEPSLSERSKRGWLVDQNDTTHARPSNAEVDASPRGREMSGTLSDHGLLNYSASDGEALLPSETLGSAGRSPCARRFFSVDRTPVHFKKFLASMQAPSDHEDAGWHDASPSAVAMEESVERKEHSEHIDKAGWEQSTCSSHAAIESDKWDPMVHTTDGKTQYFVAVGNQRQADASAKNEDAHWRDVASSLRRVGVESLLRKKQKWKSPADIAWEESPGSDHISESDMWEAAKHASSDTEKSPGASEDWFQNIGEGLRNSLIGREASTAGTNKHANFADIDEDIYWRDAMEVVADMHRAGIEDFLAEDKENLKDGSRTSWEASTCSTHIPSECAAWEPTKYFAFADKSSVELQGRCQARATTTTTPGCVFDGLSTMDLDEYSNCTGVDTDAYWQAAAATFRPVFRSALSVAHDYYDDAIPADVRSEETMCSPALPSEFGVPEPPGTCSLIINRMPTVNIDQYASLTAVDANTSWLDAMGSLHRLGIEALLVTEKSSASNPSPAEAVPREFSSDADDSDVELSDEQLQAQAFHQWKLVYGRSLRLSSLCISQQLRAQQQLMTQLQRQAVALSAWKAAVDRIQARVSSCGPCIIEEASKVVSFSKQPSPGNVVCLRLPTPIRNMEAARVRVLSAPSSGAVASDKRSMRTRKFNRRGAKSGTVSRASMDDAEGIFDGLYRNEELVELRREAMRSLSSFERLDRQLQEVRKQWREDRDVDMEWAEDRSCTV